MKLPAVLFVLFVALPIVEIYVLVRVGSVIGALPTIALVLGQGVALMPVQHRRSFRRLGGVAVAAPG